MLIFSIKAEIAVLSSFINKNPIFYIKAEGEVDFALITDGKFLPIEVKWSKLVKKEEVRQILKYSNGYILYRGFEDGCYRRYFNSKHREILIRRENLRNSRSLGKD